MAKGKKHKKNFKSNTIKVEASDPGLGFSPYQRDKGMAYTPSPEELKRKARRQLKRDLKDLKKGDPDDA